jgi:hypothetical protein
MLDDLKKLQDKLQLQNLGLVKGSDTKIHD